MSLRTIAYDHNNELLIGRAGASPPSRTAAIIFIYNNIIYIYLFIYIHAVRHALNLLRAPKK